MNICPSCKNFIHYLVVKEIISKIFIMKENKHSLTIDDFNDNKKHIIQYSCPTCEVILYENDGAMAQLFLEKYK